MALEVPVFRPPYDLTAATQAAFEGACAPFLEQSGRGLVVDLGLVGFITSGGLSQLVHLGRKLDDCGASLALAGAPRSVAKILRLVGLDTVVPHFASVEEATDYVRSRQPPRT